MKILALNPKDFYSGWPVQNDFGREFCRCFALTFPILKRLLPPGHEMRFLDGFFDPIPMNKYLELLRWPELVAMNISASYSTLSYAIAIKQIKRINPRAKIIAGGHHAYLFRKRWLQMGVDVIATGESELMFARLVEQLAGKQQYDQVPGVAFLADGQYMETAPPPQIPTLDESPEPDLDLIKIPLYRSNYLRPGGGLLGSLETSRGCVFRCKFCTTPIFWGGTQRYKSLGRVQKDLEALLARGIETIAVLDDGFGNDPDYTREFIKLVSGYRDRMNWMSFLRIDTVLKEPELIDKMGHSGMRLAYIGFESLDEDSLRTSLGKGMRVPEDLRKFQEIYHRFRRNNIILLGAFITAHPGVSKTRRTSYFAARTICDGARFGDYKPFPGTRGYDQIAEKYPMKDMFFHDTKLPVFQENNSEAFWSNLFYLLDLPRDLQLIFGGFHYRGHFLTMHRYLWSKTFRVSRRKLRDYLLLRRRDLTSDQKQEQLFQWYLDDPAYERWLDAQGARIWF